MFYATMIIATR